MRRSRAEFKFVTEKRHPKKSRSVLCQAVRVKYAFIERHEHEHGVHRMCSCLQLQPSGCYAWKADLMSPRVQDDQLLLGLLKHAWVESGRVYGYRNLNMRDLSETCGKHRVARLLKLEALRSHSGYHRRPSMRAGKPAVVASNHLQRQCPISPG